jgi:UDP-N-acetylmuramoylalanine--D-glutamate ligase
MTDLTSPELTRREDFSGRVALVCGAGVAGASAARALVRLGARTLVTDSGPPTIADSLPEQAEFLGAVDELPAGIDLVVTSPGLRPEHPLLRAAAAAGLPVLGELEFAWRIRDEIAARWLMVTGTNGKTTTVRMLESVLLAAGLQAVAVGNIGVPIIDAVLAARPYDVLAVEASSFQLHHSSTIAPAAGAVLNLAPDHLDWHGSMAAYSADKLKAWNGDVAIGNADDPVLADRLLARRPSHPVTFTLGAPTVGQLGVREETLVDHAFSEHEAELFPASQVRPAGMHNIANALAAAALARSIGVPSDAVARGLRQFEPDPHRNQFVATVNGIDYIDDSKATNPHAAAASLSGYPSIVWIAGGQLKDAPIDDLVATYAPRLRAVVLLGVDRAVIASALARHAPHLPVITVSRTDDGAMQDVVRAAASLAVAGDAVLLAPAAASLDMFGSYSARGQAFSEAVRTLRSSAGAVGES